MRVKKNHSRAGGVFTEKYVAFDLEMPNRFGDRISAIGISVIEDGRIAKRYYSLVNPECRFDPYAAELTGINAALVADKPTFPEIWDGIKDLMTNHILVGHSVQNDLHVLSNCLSSYGIEWTPTVRCLCTLTMGNVCYPDLENHRLDTMCEALEIELDHHNAASDADGSALLLLNYIAHGLVPSEHIMRYDTVKAKMAHVPKKPFPQQVEQELRENLRAMGEESRRQPRSCYYGHTEPEDVLGVPRGEIRQYAQQLSGSAKMTEYLRLLPHRYAEENDLHAYLINTKKKYSSALELTEAFLPYIDNADTCDILSPKAFARHSGELLKEIGLWLISYRSFTVRFGVNMLTRNYLDEGFTPKVLDMVYSVTDLTPDIKSALPSFYAAALEKQYEAALPYFENHLLDTDVHNRAIRRCLDSQNIPKNRKLHLRELII